MSRLGTLTLAPHGRRRHPAPDAHAQRADAARPPSPSRSDLACAARARHRALEADRLARAGQPGARRARAPGRSPSIDAGAGRRPLRVRSHRRVRGRHRHRPRRDPGGRRRSRRRGRRPQRRAQPCPQRRGARASGGGARPSGRRGSRSDLGQGGAHRGGRPGRGRRGDRAARAGAQPPRVGSPGVAERAARRAAAQRHARKRRQPRRDRRAHLRQRARRDDVRLRLGRDGHRHGYRHRRRALPRGARRGRRGRLRADLGRRRRRRCAGARHDRGGGVGRCRGPHRQGARHGGLPVGQGGVHGRARRQPDRDGDRRRRGRPPRARGGDGRRRARPRVHRPGRRRGRQRRPPAPAARGAPRATDAAARAREAAAVLGADRIEVVAGDVGDRRLGLADDAYDRLLADVVRVYHLAAIYDLAVPLDLARRVNVDGTGNVLDFCVRAERLERLAYVSTAYVAGRRTGVVYEHELVMGQGFKNHYESTKFQAEVWVRTAMARVPTTIVRPAIVVGDSNTGETAKFDGPYYILRVLSQANRLGQATVQFGASDAPFNVVPVDYVVAATAAAATMPDALGETLHLVDPDPLTTKELVTVLAREYAGRAPRGRVSPRLAEAALRIPPVRAALADTPPESIAYLNHSVAFDVRRAEALLGPQALRPPRFGDYVDAIVRFFRAHEDDPAFRPNA